MPGNKLELVRRGGRQQSECLDQERNIGAIVGLGLPAFRFGGVDMTKQAPIEKRNRTKNDHWSAGGTPRYRPRLLTRRLDHSIEPDSAQPEPTEPQR